MIIVFHDSEIVTAGNALLDWVMADTASRWVILHSNIREPVAPAVIKQGNRIRVYERRMVPGMVYEVSTSQGLLQLNKGSDGVVKIYEVYDVPEEIDA